MSERPKVFQNWAIRDFESFGPHCRFETGNPEYGFGGGTIWGLYGEKNKQTSAVTFTEDGQFNIVNDDTITIMGGVKKNGGAGVNIFTKNGGIYITADKNGNVEVKGDQVVIKANENMIIEAGKNIEMKANDIYFNSTILRTTAKLGNLVSRDVTALGQIFKDSKVGLDKIEKAASEAIDKIDVDSLKDKLPDVKDIAGKFDTADIQSSLSSALGNFGGFG